MKRLVAASLALAIVAIAGTAAGATVAAKTGGGGCHDPKTEGAGVTVDLKNNCFLPTVLHIERGAEVRFESFDKQVHTVTGVGAGSWGSYDEMPHGGKLTATFDEPGVYPYFCVFHPGMVGAIVVAEDAGPADAGATSDDAEPDGRSSRAVAASVGGGVVLALGAVATGGLVLRRRQAA
jgi:plastocyanin